MRLLLRIAICKPLDLFKATRRRPDAAGPFCCQLFTITYQHRCLVLRSSKQQWRITGFVNRHRKSARYQPHRKSDQISSTTQTTVAPTTLMQNATPMVVTVCMI
jgi:hypothetical protein